MPSVFEQLSRARARVPEVFPDPELPADQARRIADAALEGVLLFYSRRPVRVGRRNIDWSGAHLDHQEWSAQLNRFGQLAALWRMYRDSGDGRYARCARGYLEDWMDSHRPYDPDRAEPAPGDSTLNMAVRLGGVRFPGWLGVLVGLAGAPGFDEAFAEKVVASVEWQLAWLARNLPEWGNWRIAALDCLFSHALRLPDRLSEHLSPAVEALNVEFASQILADGAHVERSGGYHDWMCGVYLTLWRIAKRLGELGLALPDERVAAMHAYTLHHTKPNGGVCGFNDARAAYRTDAAGPSRLGRRLAEHRALLKEIGAGDDVPVLGVFAAAGQVFYRSGWGGDDLWWAFDAAGWGGGHSHLSRLSIELHNGRRTTLPDPGIFDYEMSNPLGPAGKSTPMHSTMNVDLGNQADVDARLVRAVDLPGAVVVQGRYAGGYFPGTFGWSFADGRGKGSFGVHDRTLVWLKDRPFGSDGAAGVRRPYMIVLDCLDHDAGAQAFLHWIGDDVPYRFDPQRLRVVTQDAEANVSLQVQPVPPARMTGSVRFGQERPYLGWVAEGLEPRPAPCFQFVFTGGGQTASLCAECATVIVPFAGRSAPRYHAAARALGREARELRIEWDDGSEDRLLYSRRLANPLRAGDGLRSDAVLVLLRSGPEGGPPRVSRVGGSYVRLGDSAGP